MAGAKVRTSKSHPLRLDWLDPPARVGMTLLPGVIDSSSEGFRWERDLATDLAALRAAGTTALVCLLEDHEFARYGVRANAILPGWIGTEMTDAAQKSDVFKENVIARVPYRRWGRPDEFGGIAVYLASDASSFHNGDSILIDGGYSKF